MDGIKFVWVFEILADLPTSGSPSSGRLANLQQQNIAWSSCQSQRPLSVFQLVPWIGRTRSVSTLSVPINASSQKWKQVKSHVSHLNDQISQKCKLSFTDCGWNRHRFQKLCKNAPRNCHSCWLQTAETPMTRRAQQDAKPVWRIDANNIFTQDIYSRSFTDFGWNTFNVSTCALDW